MLLLLLLLACLACAILAAWQQSESMTPEVDSKASWRRATLTVYESYPAPGSSECNGYNGCYWSGQFAAQSKKRPKTWVAARNIVSVHSDDFKTWKNRWVRISYNNRFIDCKVIDMCKDSDTFNKKQCSKNRDWNGNNFLLDIEVHTARRLNFKEGMANCKFMLISHRQAKYLHGSVPPDRYEKD